MGMLFSAAMRHNVGSMCEGSIMMRYPAYPLITIDPYVSIWSSSDQLNDDNTRLWFGMEKPIHGVMHIDGEHLRFHGRGRSALRRAAAHSAAEVGGL